MKYIIVVISVIVFAVILSLAILGNAGSEGSHSVVSEKSDKPHFIFMIYFKPGQEGRFREYQKLSAPIVGKYGVTMVKMIRPKQVLQGYLKQPDEIHIAYFESEDSFERYAADRDLAKIIHLREESSDVIVIKGDEIPFGGR
jgi:uncharacterized protein (DUF1330 family)